MLHIKMSTVQSYYHRLEIRKKKNVLHIDPTPPCHSLMISFFVDITLKLVIYSKFAENIKF